MTGDDFIKLGYWSQLVLLGLVDWGTIAAFMDGQGSMLHYIGFGVMNVVLLVVWWVAWKRWLRDARTPGQQPPPEV